MPVLEMKPLPITPTSIKRADDDELISVETKMNYVTEETKHPYVRRDLTGSDGEMKDVEWDSVLTEVLNGRSADITIKRNGFQLVDSEVSSLGIDFYDQNDIVQRYYKICEKLLESQLGQGVRVFAFDHNVRSAASRRSLNNSTGAAVQNPIGIVHADYTRDSAPKRLEQLAQPPKLNDIHRQFLGEGETLLDPAVVQECIQGRRRFAMANVWRNICADEPVKQFPLACMDATSLDFNDLRTFKIHYADRIGENYFCCGVPSSQVWWYFPEMSINEALLLKQWDSAGGIANLQDKDRETSTFSVHSAFPDPSSPKDASPRQSIEVRCVIVYPESNGSPSA